MSRTYKDQPIWVRANRTGKRKVFHYGCEYDPIDRYVYKKVYETPDNEYRWYQKEFTRNYLIGGVYLQKNNGLVWVYGIPEDDIDSHWVSEKVDRKCDLEFDREHAAPPFTRRKCYYFLDYGASEHIRHYYNRSPKHARKDYYSSERHETRATLKNAKDEYNLHGETDYEPYSRKRASGLYKGGWYW